MYIWAQELEACVAGDDDLLLACPREIADDGLGDGGWGLEGKVVEMHIVSP